MPTNLPPLTDPTTLGIGTIGIAYGFTFIVQDDPQKGLYWKEIDPELDWDNIEFWTLGMDLKNGQVRIIPKAEKLVINGVEQEVNNPIPITITFSNTQVLTQIQDYGAVYSQQNNWTDLLSIDAKNPFSENNRQVKQKLTDDIGVQWKYKERLKTELEENVFFNDEKNSKKVYDKIIGSWVDIFTWVNDVVTKFYRASEPKTEFKVGDFVVDDTWSFPLKIKKLDSGNGQFECVQADGYNENDTLLTVPEKTQLFEKQPKFKVGDRIVHPITQNGGILGGSAKQLIEKAKNEKLGYLVVTNVTYNRYKNDLFDYWLGFQDLPNASVSFEEEECKLYEPTPEKIIQKGEFYLKDPNVWLATEDSKEGIGFQYILMEASRYFTASIWQNLNFISFVLSDLAFRKFGELSVALHYNYTSGFSFYLKKQALEIVEVEIKNLGVAQAVAQRIILFLATVDVELSDEFTQIWKLLEDGIERGIIRADWRLTPKDCEADPNKIISGQVKKFYDLNKARIDKLDTKISCKIIQALVGLSEYESCGSPSSSSLPKAKTDLLSRISKLKI